MSKTLDVQKALNANVVIEGVQSMSGAESIAPDHMGRGRVPASGYVPQPITVDPALLREVEVLLYRQAALLDARNWQGWIDLFADDGVYWVPANGEDIDPERMMSIIYDNRSRISLRVNQFYTGKRYTQEPKSRLRRVVSNVEIAGEEGDCLVVIANALTFEAASRGDVLWASKNEYRLRRVQGEWKMARKKVVLANNHNALYTMSFLI